MFTYVVIIVIPIGSITRNRTKTCNLWALLKRQASKFVGLRWKTIGSEDFVVLSNHQTALDVLAVAHIWESFGTYQSSCKKRAEIPSNIG